MDVGFNTNSYKVNYNNSLFGEVTFNNHITQKIECYGRFTNWIFDIIAPVITILDIARKDKDNDNNDVWVNTKSKINFIKENKLFPNAQEENIKNISLKEIGTFLGKPKINATQTNPTPTTSSVSESSVDSANESLTDNEEEITILDEEIVFSDNAKISVKERKNTDFDSINEVSIEGFESTEEELTKKGQFTKSSLSEEEVQEILNEANEIKSKKEKLLKEAQNFKKNNPNISLSQEEAQEILKEANVTKSKKEVAIRKKEPLLKTPQENNNAQEFTKSKLKNSQILTQKHKKTSEKTLDLGRTTEEFYFKKFIHFTANPENFKRWPSLQQKSLFSKAMEYRTRFKDDQIPFNFLNTCYSYATKEAQNHLNTLQKQK